MWHMGQPGGYSISRFLWCFSSFNDLQLYMIFRIVKDSFQYSIENIVTSNYK
uniref:Uncharacterized protein n=1 Tax=Siphoviridae sp. ctABi4 TaxID=2823566 RepID=A0A8S5LFE8_9CAUD|nr:MAG TPA: hypothetical protein [Siphoviridae sp. ctABi4]